MCAGSAIWWRDKVRCGLSIPERRSWLAIYHLTLLYIVLPCVVAVNLRVPLCVVDVSRVRLCGMSAIKLTKIIIFIIITV